MEAQNAHHDATARSILDLGEEALKRFGHLAQDERLSPNLAAIEAHMSDAADFVLGKWHVHGGFDDSLAIVEA